MPSIAYGAGCYRRDNGNLPELKLVNMFLEQAQTSENQVCLLSRPGLGLLATNGAGPINGLYCKAGTLNGDVFSISGTALYRGTAAIASGTIAGTGAASFAGSDSELLVTRGGVMRSYTTAIANVAFPDSAAVRAVCFIGSRFVAVRGDGAFPGRFYWSALLDGRTWNGLDYATAEREPDDLLDIAPLGDNIWLFGQSTIESWADTGDASLPFARIEQVAFDQGIMATGCVVGADNTLFFIGSERMVYRLGDTPQRVSHNGIEERIVGSTSARMFTFWFQGHEFVAIRLDDETLLYDCATQEWCEFQTAGGNWIAAYAAMAGKTVYFGHATTGQLMGWSEWDDLGVELERLFTAAVPHDAPASINRVSLWVNAGHTPLLDGQGSDPVIEMRHSDDGGNTFSDFEGASIGASGQFRIVPEWRRLGQFDFPGFIAEFRVSDPVPLRVSAVKVNDMGGGRARA